MIDEFNALLESNALAEAAHYAAIVYAGDSSNEDRNKDLDWGDVDAFAAKDEGL